MRPLGERARPGYQGTPKIPRSPSLEPRRRPHRTAPSPPRSPPGPTRSRRPSSCSTGARRCLSSRATARKRPAGLDDTQLRKLSERLTYLRELEARRAAILKSITEQGKLTDELARAIAAAETKAALEDIYLPFKPKRRTKAMIARENGLEPLLRGIRRIAAPIPQTLAEGYVTEAVPGTRRRSRARATSSSRNWRRTPHLLGRLRDFMRDEALIAARVIARQGRGRRQVLGLFRPPRALVQGRPPTVRWRCCAPRKEEIVTVDIAPEPETGADRADGIVAADIGIPGDGPGDRWLREVAGWAWRVKLSLVHVHRPAR